MVAQSYVPNEQKYQILKPKEFILYGFIVSCSKNHQMHTHLNICMEHIHTHLIIVH